MAKVTSKLQVTVPKALAVQVGIQPGDDVDWTMSGDGLRVTPSKHRRSFLDLETRLRLFNEATDRQRRRERDAGVTRTDGDRGWSREDLYDLAARPPAAGAAAGGLAFGQRRPWLRFDAPSTQ